MTYSPTYSQSHYLQIPTLSQTAVYTTPSAYAPSEGYVHTDYYRHVPINGTMHGLQYPAAYPNGLMVYGTRNNVPCTWMSSGLRPVALRLHSVVEADVFKNRSLDNPSMLLHGHDNFPDESTMSPSGPQNASNYGEKQANGYRISIPGLRNSISSNASCILPQYSSNAAINHEKGVATTINQRVPPAISRMRGIKLFIICCLVALFLLSVGLVRVLYPEWQFSRFTFIV